MSANNAAKSANMKHAIKGELPEQEIKLGYYTNE